MIRLYLSLAVALMAAPALAQDFTLAPGSLHTTHDVLITEGVPTVPGIQAAPVPTEQYDTRRPHVRYRAAAEVQELDEPAPPNGCLTPAFRVMSGPKRQRGCYGAQ